MTPIFEDVLRALLVGTDVAGTRVFLARAPQVPADQQRMPYLVFFPVGPTPRHSMGGPVSVHDVEYQVSIFDPSQSKALWIAETIRKKLDGIRGDYAGVRFGGMFYHSQSSSYEDHANVHHVFATYRILYEFLPEFENLTLNKRNPNATERRSTL